MRGTRIWKSMLGLEAARVVIEDVEAEDGGRPGLDGSKDWVDEVELQVVAHVRPVAREQLRCPSCRRRCGKYDDGQGRRRWRALDLGTVRAYLEADAPRINCPDHGVLVAAVPWARHGAGHTDFLDDTVAWLVTQTSKSAVAELMRISWRTVGNIVKRVWNDIDASHDRFAGVRRIGIDEISYKKHHKYLTVVCDHDSRRLLWVGVGRTKKTLGAFFDALGEQRSHQLTHVSADGADYIATVVAMRAPQAIITADPFHVIGWATEALDTVRKDVWNTARRHDGGSVTIKHGTRIITGSAGAAKDLKRARYALWKNPEDLTTRQQLKLDWIAKTHPYLHRAYLLKEGLRTALKLPGQEGIDALLRWRKWAARCRIPQFVELGQKIRNHLDAIHASIEHGLSNGLVESTNTKIRLIIRRAFGFGDTNNLIALALLRARASITASCPYLQRSVVVWAMVLG